MKIIILALLTLSFSFPSMAKIICSANKGEEIEVIGKTTAAYFDFSVIEVMDNGRAYIVTEFEDRPGLIEISGVQNGGTDDGKIYKSAKGFPPLSLNDREFKMEINCEQR